ncbi:hypothetical protein PAEPH01_2799 [Pancytospora epiphaga]|nr:hypothetical protein PAEPH01_2799 [Pancytospora epiphaga]
MNEGDGSQYYPALFSRPEIEHEVQESGQVIPQNTLYDMPLQSRQVPGQRHVTVFGFSHENRANVLSRIRKMVAIKKKEEGRNYMNVWADDPAELDGLLVLNHQLIEGEIIGVFRKNFGLTQTGDIYQRRKGIFRIIKEYLFGED